MFNGTYAVNISNNVCRKKKILSAFPLDLSNDLFNVFRKSIFTDEFSSGTHSYYFVAASADQTKPVTIGVHCHDSTSDVERLTKVNSGLWINVVLSSNFNLNYKKRYDARHDGT